VSRRGPAGGLFGAAVLVLAAAVVAVGGAGAAEPVGGVSAREVRLHPADTVLACAGPPRLPTLPGTPSTDGGFVATAETATAGRAVAPAGGDAPALALQATDRGAGGVVVQGRVSGSVVSAAAPATGQQVARAVPARGAAEPAALASMQSAVTPAGDLRGMAASACAVPGEELWLLGGATVVGRSARLDLVNPGQTPSTVDVAVLTDTGTSTPQAGQHLVLAPGERTEVPLEALVPEAAALGVRVAAAGSPVGASLVETALRGLTPAGVETVVPGVGPRPEQVVPGVAVRKRSADPVLRLAAPGEEDAVVRWRILGRAGQVGGEGPAAATVPAGSVLDVQLDGLPAGPYTLVVDADVPVVAAAASSSGDGRGPTDRAWSASTDPLTGTVPVALPEGVRARLLLSAVGTGDGAGEGARVEVQALDAGGSVTGRVGVPLADGATSAVDVRSLAPGGAAALLVTVPPGADGVHGAVELTAPAHAGPALTSVLVLRPAPPAPGSVRVVQSSRW
jgi:hypothetical protein